LIDYKHVHVAYSYTVCHIVICISNKKRFRCSWILKKFQTCMKRSLLGKEKVVF